MSGPIDEVKAARSRRGKAARVKGGSIERAFVNEHIEMGVHAQRVPLSGGTSYAKGDVELGILGGLVGEGKSRKNGAGFATIRNWLGSHDFLFLKEDGEKSMMVLPWGTWEKIVGALSGDQPAPAVERPRRVGKHVCPMDFQPDPASRKLAVSLGVDPDLARAEMIDWSHSDAHKNKKTSWDATYRNWVRRAAANRRQPMSRFQPQPPVTDDGGRQNLEDAQERTSEAQRIRALYGQT